MDLSGFNADDFSDIESYSILPAGTYTAAIVSSENKTTKNGNGSYLELQLEIIDGQYAGRKVWDRLNLRNPNQTAVEIAMRTLASICKAIGIKTPRDSSELHNKPMNIKVSVREYNGNESNEVKKYMPAERQQAKPSPTTTTVEKAPWE
jgi:uncharacterized protein involved in exopolysaccharide biosynthesis